MGIHPAVVIDDALLDQVDHDHPSHACLCPITVSQAIHAAGRRRVRAHDRRRSDAGGRGGGTGQRRGGGDVVTNAKKEMGVCKRRGCVHRYSVQCAVCVGAGFGQWVVGSKTELRKANHNPRWDMIAYFFLSFFFQDHIGVGVRGCARVLFTTAIKRTHPDSSQKVRGHCDPSSQSHSPSNRCSLKHPNPRLR